MKINKVEAKLNAIDNLKMYQQKAKVSKFNQAHLDEVSNIYKHTLHQLVDVDHVNIPSNIKGANGIEQDVI